LLSQFALSSRSPPAPKEKLWGQVAQAVVVLPVTHPCQSTEENYTQKPVQKQLP